MRRRRPAGEEKERAGSSEQSLGAGAADSEQPTEDGAAHGEAAAEGKQSWQDEQASEGKQSFQDPQAREGKQNLEDKQAGTEEDGNWACHICLEECVDPCCTLCGHLFCWPCLYQWIETGHNTCPCCKAGITRQNVIPLYGRGRKLEDTEPGGQDIPDRPRGQRPRAVPPLPPFRLPILEELANPQRYRNMVDYDGGDQAANAQRAMLLKLVVAFGVAILTWVVLLS